MIPSNINDKTSSTTAAIAIICPNSVESSSPNNFALNPNDVGAIALPTAKPAWIGSLKIIYEDFWKENNLKTYN